MEKYRSLHLWMFLPMAIMQWGIFADYWGDFTDNAWSVHVHYWTGTIWYSYLIIQPYFITHGQIERHKTNGIIGFFIAGGVGFSAFSMMHRDIVSAQRAAENPEAFGPFEPWFFYGVIVVEIVMIIGFGYAIIMGIINRKNLESHAWWLISTVYIIMMPALSRGIGNLYIERNIQDWPNISLAIPGNLTQAIILLLLLLTAWKFKKLKHPATYLALGINIFIFFLEPIGKSTGVQTFLKTILQG